MSSDPERPAQESQTFGGIEYPSLESSKQPVDYPFDAGLPPPIYAPPPSGYPGAPGYYPTYDPYRPTKPPGTNGTAIAALVTSITGLMCCAPLALVGVILGVVAMRETRRTGQDGYGVALAGTIIGGLLVAAGLIGMLLYIALMVSGWQWT